MLENHFFFDLKAHFQWFSNSVTHGVGKLLKLSHSTWLAFTFWVQMRHFEWFSHHVHSVVSHEFFPGLIESRILGNYPLYAHGGWLPTFCILIACQRVKIENRCRYSKFSHRSASFFSGVGIGGSSSRSFCVSFECATHKRQYEVFFFHFHFWAAALLSLS